MWLGSVGEVGSAENPQESGIWPFTTAVAELVGPSVIHTDKMGILDGLWRSDEGCFGPEHKDADLWENMGAKTELSEKNWEVYEKHVKAHRSVKGKGQTMTTEENILGRQRES